MSNDNNGSDSGYEIGHGKPPKNTRFGAKNGNPINKKGRPKGPSKREFSRMSQEAFWSCFTNAAQMPVEITENGERITVPLIDATAKRMAVAMANDDRFARRDFLKYLNQSMQGADQLYLEMHNIFAHLREQRLRFASDQGSLEHLNFLHDYFMAKRELRLIDGDDRWIYEDDEPITDEDWATFFKLHSYLKQNPIERIEWPPEYPSDDPKE